METLNDFKMNSSQVKESPKDVKLDGVIIKIDKGILREFLPENIDLTNWEGLDNETLLIHFETKFEDRTIGGTDRLTFYEEPLSNSKLGKFLQKYDELKVAQRIKINFNGKGYSSILLE